MYDIDGGPEPTPRDEVPETPVNDMVDRHAQCVRCSYDLHGLSREGMCPECGLPVLRSLQGNRLQFSAPEYLRSILRGDVLIMVAIAGRVLIWISMAALAVFPGSLSVLVDVLAILQGIAGLGLAVVALLGWWLFTAPDPSIIGTETAATARRIVRLTVIIDAALLPLTYALPLAADPTLLDVAIVAGWVAAINFLVHYFAGLQYMIWMGGRVPSPTIVDRAMTLRWLGPALVIGGMLLVYLIANLGIPCVGALVAMAWFGAMLTLLVMYWNMLYWLYEEVKVLMSE